LHEVGVSLAESAYGGTCAVVLLRSALLVDQPGVTDQPELPERLVAAVEAGPSTRGVTGGADRPLPLRGADQLPLRGADQLPLRGADQLPLRGADQLPLRGADQPPVSSVGWRDGPALPARRAVAPAGRSELPAGAAAARDRSSAAGAELPAFALRVGGAARPRDAAAGDDHGRRPPARATAGTDGRPALPRRVRQANLVAALREPAAADAGGPAGRGGRVVWPEDPGTSGAAAERAGQDWPSAERVRDRLSAFQRASRDGRNAPEWPADPGEGAR
jgi:hypothetical protein